MNNTSINIFNSDNSKIAYINTEHCQNMTIIAYRILKFQSMIKKSTMANHTFFAVVTFSKTLAIPLPVSILLQYRIYNI